MEDRWSIYSPIQGSNYAAQVKNGLGSSSSGRSKIDGGVYIIIINTLARPSIARQNRIDGVKLDLAINKFGVTRGEKCVKQRDLPRGVFRKAL